jgi:DeoR/GlpR family transcriptional regulator of sugar metabolism
MQDYSVAERRHAILEQISQQGRVAVADLSQAFGVSEVTIRADLQALAEQNLLVRTHGGAIPTSRLSPDLSLALRRQQQVLAKDHIGEAGAALVRDGDSIFLDTSSTALAIARHLTDRRHVTVITNSLAIIQELLDRPGIDVVVPGGRLRRETASLIGVDGAETLTRYNIQKGFFGAHGLSVAEGLTDVSADEAEVKRLLVNRCRQVIAVIDATKWGRAGLASFARVADVDVVITDHNARPDLVEQVKSAGVEVMLV